MCPFFLLAYYLYIILLIDSYQNHFGGTKTYLPKFIASLFKVSPKLEKNKYPTTGKWMAEQSTTHPDKGMSFNNKKSIILIPLGQSQKRHAR